MSADSASVSVGDVVQLKSGGPYMTVAWVSTGVEARRGVEVYWFSESGLQSANMPASALIPAAGPADE